VAKEGEAQVGVAADAVQSMLGVNSCLFNRCQRSSNSLPFEYGVQVIPYRGVQVIPHPKG